MTENVYKLVMLGFVTGSWLFLSSMFLLKRKPRSFLFHAGIWAVLMVYFILYEFLMSYHGEVAWFPAGLVEIAVMMTVVAVNNEGDLWRNFCIVVLQQGVGSLFFTMAAISEAAGVPAEYYRIPATSNICYELFDFGVDECVLCHCNTYSEIHFPEGIYRGWTSVPEYHDRVYSDRVRIPCFALEAD